jgi:hypothetical protein
MDDDLIKQLRDPRLTVPEFCSVVDQKTEDIIQYDADRVCPRLQHSILSFMGDTPRDSDGMTQWLIVNASRQTTKSTTTALAMANLAEYTPGAFAAIIADKKERAEDLFRAIDISYEYKPEEIKYPTISNRESRQLTFTHKGKIRTLAANQENVGIGRGASFLHMSELPFWNDPADVWFKMGPAFRNRENAVIVMESTPAPMSEPGAEWYRDMCAEARKGHGRFKFLFVPFYESKLNERMWRNEWRLDSTEMKLMEKYGPPSGIEPVSMPGAEYLTLENLAFRRRVMEEDKLIRRYPELFFVFYPVNSITCWQQPGGGAIPAHVLEKHIDSNLTTWAPKDNMYMEYKEPHPDGVYVIGVDPAGFGSGDQASFQVLELWADQWEQVATFSSNQPSPPEVARYVLETAKRYNNAEVVVENNGVGAGILSVLELASDYNGVVLVDSNGRERKFHLKNLYYHRRGSAGSAPGIPASKRTNSEAMAAMIDALMDRLVLNDAETVEQLRSYRRDKELEDSEKFKLLQPNKLGRGRRAKHHWDRISALLWACLVARDLPVRYKPKTQEDKEQEEQELQKQLDKPFDAWTYEEQQAYYKTYEKKKGKKSRG